MDAFDDPNVYTDITVPVGCDLTWAFQLEPWDGTSTTATFTIGVTAVSMTLVVTGGGTTDATTQFGVHMTPAALAAIGMNVPGATLPYTIRWTDTGGVVWALGYGTVVAQ